METKDERKRVAVDIDGTITKKGRFPEIWEITPSELYKAYATCEPDEEMIQVVNNLYDQGIIVYLYTSRCDLHEKVTKDWLKKHGVKYNYFIMNKPFYDFLIDDKAIHPEQVKLWQRNQRNPKKTR